MQWGSGTLENNLVILYKAMYTLTAWSRKTSLGFALYINENLNPYRNYKWMFPVGLFKKRNKNYWKQPKYPSMGE